METNTPVEVTCPPPPAAAGSPLSVGGDGGLAKAPVQIFPVPHGVAHSRVYALTANGQPVPVLALADAHYGHFAFAGECAVALSVPPSIGHRNLKYIHAYDIRPKRREVPSWCEVNTLYFKLVRPTKLVIRVNEHERFFLFADALDPETPRPGQSGVISLSDFATDNTGRDLQTARLQAAVDATPKNGVLYIPAGVYRTGTFSLKSDMTLYLAGGSVLKGSSDGADFPAEAPTWCDARWQFLRVANAENVRIAGCGTIDGNGAALRSQQHGPTLLFLRDCRRVMIEDIFVREPACMCVHMAGCEDVTIRNLKGINDRNVLNADGITVESSRRVRIDDVFHYCADDAACIKVCAKGGAPVDDAVFRGGLYLTKKSALKIGTETHAEINHVTFADNDVVECDRGMTLVCEDGGPVCNTTYINNRFELPYPDTRRRLIDFYTWNRNGGGRIENTLIKDCIADRKWPRPSTLFPASGPIDGVHFENFVLDGKVCHSLRDADLLVDTLPCNDDRRANARNITFERGVPVNLALLDK